MGDFKYRRSVGPCTKTYTKYANTIRDLGLTRAPMFTQWPWRDDQATPPLYYAYYINLWYVPDFK